MKKYFAISSIIAAMLLIIGGIGLFITGGAFNGLSFDSNGINLKGDYKTLTQEIDVKDSTMNFILYVPNSKVDIKTGDQDKITVNCIYNDEDDKFIIESDDNTVKITRKDDELVKVHLFNLMDIAGAVEIIVPKGLEGKYTVEATNGSIKISDIQAQSIDMHTTNGNFEISDIQSSGEVVIDTTNGRISAEEINAISVDFKTTNGVVAVEDIKADKIRVKTTNGIIDAEDCYSKDLTLRTTNGAINLDNESDKGYVIENLDVETTNGRETINANYKNRN